ncbi:MAG TPA: hypothetical protein DCW87_14170, partial [Comamonadaceae bacterium]|nr:hypothetical protein [Comamonadaceae bacterium]
MGSFVRSFRGAQGRKDNRGLPFATFCTVFTCHAPAPRTGPPPPDAGRQRPAVQGRHLRADRRRHSAGALRCTLTQR